MTFARTAGHFGSAALLVALALLTAGASGAVAAQAGDPEGPTCAEGPVREGDTIRGTPCADTIVVPASVAYVNGGAGD